MKQLFLQKGNVFFREVPIPQLNVNDVLVKVHYSFVSSGTENSTINASSKSLLEKFTSNTKANVEKVLGAIKENGVSGTVALIKNKANFTNSLGYSCSGQVVAVGEKVEKFRVGDFVACAGSGLANHAQVVCVPQNLVVKLGSNLFLKQASITTIGAIAMQGIRRADLRLGEKVCVLGLGLIGQITVQLAKLCGCQVFGIDLQQDRLELAEKLGADFVFDPRFSDIKKEIDFATSHQGVDATIITAASSSGQVIQSAMNVTRRKGRVVLVGDVKLDFDRDPFYSKEIDFLISCSYGPGRYDNSYEKEGKDYPFAYVRWTENRNMELFVDLIKQEKISIDSLISQEFELEQVDKAYSHLRNNNALGVVLSYSGDKECDLKNLTDQIIKNFLPYVPPKGEINTAFVGAGGFAKIKLLPVLSKLKNIKISALVDSDATNLINVANLYGVEKIASDYHKLSTEDDMKMVIIATPHKFHLKQSLYFLKAGKAVFVEKPAAVSFDQLNKLQDFFKVNKNSFYCVDFNRSFAPFNLAIKREVSKRKNPLIMHYRMNAGFIPKEHWIQSESHGGRIIGEACHIFELFNFLTDAKPISVSVESLNHASDSMASNDNVSVQLRMDDGSCCSLIYTAVGSTAMNKERMEIFFDGKSIVMDDYKELKGYGLPISFNQKAGYPDKGHEVLLEKFVKAAKTENPKSPIPVERILLATKISLIVDKLARSGGGFEVL